jgi:enoyl-CoA hydratase/carnithine racemase
MSYQDILYETDGPILTITLNRPDKLNAYTAVMGQELADAFHRANEDDAIRVVIVTGAGRGFCAGPTSRRARRVSTPAKAARRRSETQPMSRPGAQPADSSTPSSPAASLRSRRSTARRSASA